MTVATETKTGQRTVIDYLLSPLMRYRHERLSERRWAPANVQTGDVSQVFSEPNISRNLI